MENKKKIDDQIMKKLDANTIRRPICLTNKGALELVIVKGGDEYYLTLDSVPVEKELNRELMDILFKIEVPQVNKYEEVSKLAEKIAEVREGAKDKIFQEQIIIPKKKSYYKPKTKVK